VILHKIWNCQKTFSLLAPICRLYRRSTLSTT